MNDIPPLPSPCGGPSLQQLRQLDTGELNDLEAHRVRSHASACGHCQLVLREFEADRAAIRTLLPYPALEASLPARSSRWPQLLRRFAFAGLVPFGAAAAFFLAPAFRHPASDVESSGQGIRSKGVLSTTPSLNFFVQAPNGARTGRDGEALKEGDRIRLRYDPAGNRFVLIVGVDADGQVFPYLANGDRSALAQAGEVLVPNSITLDGDPRPERVFAIYSTEPIAVDEVKPVARDAVRSAGGHVEQLAELPLGHVTQRSLLINKATR